MTRVLGIDPSLSATGVAEHTGDAYPIEYPRHIDGDRRLLVLQREVDALAHWHDVAVVEDLPTHAHGAGKTGMAQGVVRAALLAVGCPYVTVPAATVKKFATGRGTATKPDMRMAWFQRTQQDVRDDNAVDALWLRALGLHLVGEPLFDLPKTHTAALAKLALPDLEVAS